MSVDQEHDTPVIINESLSFDLINRLKDEKRFLIKEVDSNFYIFDRHISMVFEISDSFCELIRADKEAEFDKVVEAMPSEEVEANLDFLHNLLEIEDSPVEEIYTGQTSVSILKLNISSKCNLSCSYCFREKEQPQMLDDRDLIYKAIDYMVFECGKDAPSYTVCYSLTGEPLLHQDLLEDIFKYIKKTMKKIRKRIDIFFVTNGTFITAKSVKMLKKIWGDRPIAVSIDGPKDIHDSVRIYENGKGTYDQIMDNVNLLRKKGVRTTAEAVLTAMNPYPIKVATHLLEQGFAWINMKPVRQGTPYSFTLENIHELKKGYDEYFSFLTDKLLEGDFYPLKVFSKDYAIKPLWRILFNNKMDRRCGWGINSISMDHKGDFYPCDSAMGFEECKTGNVHEGIDWEKYREDLSVEHRYECGNCLVRNICGGTCYVNGLYAGKDLISVDPVECSLTKYLIDANLQMICRLMSGGVNMGMVKQILYVNLTGIYRLV